VVELLLSWSSQLEIPEVPSRAPLSFRKACACAGVNGLPSAKLNGTQNNIGYAFFRISAKPSRVLLPVIVDVNANLEEKIQLSTNLSNARNRY
jgi:hypothetical protein